MREFVARLFSYYRPHRRLFLLDFDCGVTSGLLELGFPIAVKLFIDVLLPTGQWGVVAAASAGLMVIYLINGRRMAVATYWATCSASISRRRCAARPVPPGAQTIPFQDERI